MRKGQFIFNFLRDYFSIGTINNPYPNCHYILFNISDEYWEIIEKEYEKFKQSPQTYEFPKKPFGKSIISKEHGLALSEMFRDIFRRKNESKR